MALGDPLVTGTASLDDGSPADLTVVHIAGVMLTLNDVLRGDTFWHGGLSAKIAEVEDDRIVLFNEWPGEAFSDEPVFITRDSWQRFSVLELANTAQDIRTRLRLLSRWSPLIRVGQFGVNDVPVSPEIGQTLVVGTSPSGVFVGHNNEIAEYTETGAWAFFIPESGWHVVSANDNVVRHWTGSSWMQNSGLAFGIRAADPLAWDNLRTFTTGQVTRHLGRLWVSNKENSDSEPGLESEDWNLFLDIVEDGGAFTLRYTFSTDVEDTAPAPGTIKLNGAPNAATILRINPEDLAGSDWGGLIDSINTSATSNNKGKIRLAVRGETGKQWIANVMSATAVGSDPVTHYNLSISSPNPGTDSIKNGDEVLFMFQERGDVGQQGIQGIQGPTGNPGGAAAIRYTFSSGAATGMPPAQSLQLNLTNTQQNQSTFLHAASLSAIGTMVNDLLDSIASASTSAVKVTARLYHLTNPERYLTFRVTGIDVHVGYRRLNFSITGWSAAQPFANGDPVVLDWSAKGDKGDGGTIESATADTGLPGSEVQVALGGTAHTRTLHFVVPRGAPGQPLRPHRTVSLLGDRAQFDAFEPITENHDQFMVMVLSDVNNGNEPSLYFLIEKAAGETPATWIGPFDPYGALTEAQVNALLDARPDAFALAAIL